MNFYLYHCLHGEFARKGHSLRIVPAQPPGTDLEEAAVRELRCNWCEYWLNVEYMSYPQAKAAAADMPRCPGELYRPIKDSPWFEYSI